MRFFIPVLAALLIALVSCDSKKSAPDPVATPTPTPVVKPLIEGSLEFGAVDVETKTSRSLVLKNPGATHLNVTGISYPAGFSGEEDPFSIDPGASRTIEVVFAPDQAGDYSGTLSVSIAGEALEIPVGGSAKEKTGILELTGNLTFDEIPVGETSAAILVLKNTGNAPLHVAGISLPDGFRGTFSGSIEPGAERKTRLVFAPTEAKKHTGPLTIELTSGTGQTTLQLDATSTPPPPAPQGMVTVPAGILPESSQLAGESVTTFHIAPYETTWGEWNTVREFATLNGYDLPAAPTNADPNRPVRGISWTDAVKWCNAKSQRDGLPPVYFVEGEVFRTGDSKPQAEPNSDGYRLPTEAEWEWAARGSLSGRGETFSGSNDLNEVAWNWDNATASGENLLDGRGTAPVGLKNPNELGLHDMSGNVAEWCSNESENGARRIRGGAWFGSPADCAVAARASNPSAGADFIGFRTARNRATTQAQQSSQDSSPTFSTESNLPEALVGSPYSASIELQGGTEPLSLSLEPGESLPVGLSLVKNQITGTPTSAGTSNFTLVATDSSNPVNLTAERKFSLRVAPYGLSISPDPDSIQASYSQPVSISFQAQGGEAPYRWTAENPVPSGLTLNPQTGELTGKPATAGPFSLALRVRDAKGFSATRIVPLSIDVEDIQLAAEPATAPESTAGLPFSWSVQITGGVPPYTADPLPSTPLPEGLSVSTRGNTATISGKPEPAGDFASTLVAKDSSGRQAKLDLRFSVKPYDLAIDPGLAKSLQGKFREALDLPFNATGGKPPYVWSLEGKLPPGVYLSSSGGLKGNPSTQGEFPVTVKVTDANRLSASVDAVLEIDVDPLRVTADPAKATAGLPFNWPLKITGGIPPYKIQLAEGSSLPEGLAINSAGISGNPAAAGESRFTIEALDSSGLKTPLDLSLAVKPYDLTVKTPMPKGEFATPIEIVLTASGGKEPYSWSIEGKLPAGLYLSRSGKIEGTPATAGKFPFVLKVTDANRLSATANATLTITVDPLKFSSSPVEAVEGVALNQAFSIEGGVPPYSVQLAEGSTLPEGLVLSTTGISGRPAVPGEFQYTVAALDSSGLRTTLDLSLSVQRYDLLINSPLLKGSLDERFDIPLSALGGKQPYAWSIEGKLPQGLTLSRAGKIEGTPATAGEFPIVLKVTDANRITATVNTTLTITPAPLKISTTPVEATAGLALDQAFKIQGGVPPYTVQLAEGSTLPEGLVLATTGISGKPVTAGDYPVTVTALDSSGLRTTLDLTLAVKRYDLIINSPLLKGPIGERFEIPLSALGGKKPYVWSIEGNLPPGLSLSRSGKIEGTPAAAGEFPIALKVTDANRLSTTVETSVTIAEPASTPAPAPEASPEPTPALAQTPTPTPAPKPAPKLAGDEVDVEGGTLPLTSTLAGKTVGNFSIARTEVTWGDWKKIRSQAAELGYDIAEAGEGTGDKHPVRNVSWFDVVKWCNLRSEMEGLDPVYVAEGTVFRSGEKTPELSPGANGYRLPTEAEWEWAARGGKSSQGHTYSGSDDPAAVALHAANNPASGTKPSASFAANELGLHDMSGNVREWVWDSHKNYRRFRGGGFNDETFGCTISGSDFNYPNRRTPDTGFRTVRGQAQ